MDSLPGAPDERASLELVDRIRGGDRGAWEELFRRYHDPLLFAARMQLGPGLRAVLQSDDIFQSVALDALGSLRGFEYRGPGSLEAYLKRMVLNKIRDRAKFFRAERRAAGVGLDDEGLHEQAAAVGEGPFSGYHEAATYERLERAVRALPDDQREVLLLRKLEGRSSREVAEALGKSDEAVRQLTSRAMARVARTMAEE